MDEDEPVPESATAQTGPDVEAASATEVSMPSTGDHQAPSERRSQRKTSRRLVIGVVLALVMVAAVIGLAFALSSTPTTISTGTGSATITWTPVSTNSDPVSSPPQPFRGTIEGITASGVATMPLTAGGAPSPSPSGAFPTKLEVAQWKGTFGGKSFTVGIFAQYSPSESITIPTPTFPTVTIIGRWGIEPVKGKVDTPTAAELNSGNGPLHFAGTVGQFKVSGTVQPPTGHKSRQSLASFTVAK